MLVDLSVPLEEDMPGFPGYPGFEHEPLQTYEADGKLSHRFSTPTHQGTHIDAPAHFIPDGETIDDLPLDLFVGPARVVDLREHRGEPITAEHLADAVPGLDPGARVVLLTGDVDAKFSGPAFFEDAAVLTSSAAEWLLDRDVSLVANDFLTEGLDTPARPVHHALLGAGVPIVEYLRNADAIAEFDTVEFVCLPLSMPGFEATPVRAVARPGPDR
jgi:arylformamidase